MDKVKELMKLDGWLEIEMIAIKIWIMRPPCLLFCDSFIGELGSKRRMVYFRRFQ